MVKTNADALFFGTANIDSQIYCSEEDVDVHEKDLLSKLFNREDRKLVKKLHKDHEKQVLENKCDKFAYEKLKCDETCDRLMEKIKE
jgi:hypothetical protein